MVISKKQDNKGFTLVEVLLSIVIIAIVFVSSMNAFVDVAKVNRIAKQEQNATTSAQNILEDLNSMTIKETAIEYYKRKYPEGVISGSHNFTEYTISSVVESIKNSIMSYSFLPPSGRESYSYVIANVEENGTVYDAMVTLNPTTYSDSNKYPTSMNNYQVPKLLTLNNSIVAIIDMKSLQATDIYDAEALSYFKSFHATYVNAIEAQPTPIPAHSNYSDTQISNSLSKNVNLILTKDITSKEVDISCSLEYSCNLDLNDDGNKERFNSEVVYKGRYTLPVSETEKNDIYLFYTPSEFVTNYQDTITIVNSNLVKANIYIAYQKSINAITPVTILKMTTTEIDTSDMITVFANFQGMINSTPINSGKLYEETAMDNRIYNITVSVYPQGSITKNDFSNPYVTLTSVKEE